MQTNKDRVRCVVIVATWRIEGDVHVLTGSRLTDMLNSKAKDFFVMTDAVVSDAASGAELHRVSYVAVNRSEAALVFPAG